MEVCEPVKMSPKKDTLTSPSPNAQTKGLKQVRLPFKQLDQKIVSPVTSGKKRKLSSGESSASKITKTNFSITPKSSGKPKLPIQRPENVALKSDENEVSSSSEAENMPLQDGRKSKPRFIEKFLEAAQQREVSTSGEVVDLSLEMEEKDCDISGVTAQDVEDESKEYDTEGESGSTTENSEMEVVIDSEEAKEKQDVPVPTADKKVFVIPGSKQKKAVPKIEDLFSAAAKMQSTAKRSGDDMVTPAKVLKTSELQTPQSSGSPSEITSPGSTSAVKVSPTSAVVEKKTLSLKKKQEKEMERLKKKEEKEKEKLEKQKQRDEAKAVRDRKKQEEKDKKEQERLQKEREKQEKKEQAEKERLDKLKQKEGDKQKKLEALEEEKRKREEEKKKKEDEKRIKEEEKKKDEEEKNLKAKAVFTSFFIKPETSPTSKPAAREETGLFRGFYVNKDMTLAPSKRAHAHLEGFDSEFESQECGTLYLDDLKSGSRQPVRTGKLTSGVVNGDDDVVVVKEDKADNAPKEDGDPEIEDGCPKTMKTKYLKFKENNRPAYRGTWRKTSNILTPRNPFKMDKDLFDYEYDSDDDWEEEEPGESLSNSEGEGDDEDDKPSNDAEPDDDEDGFFVPHGYLSEDEGCDEEEELNPEKLKALQIAKAKAFEMEMKRKCEYMRAVVIGCCWMNATHQIPEVYSRLEAYEAVPLSSTPIITACNKKKLAVKDDEKPKSKGFKKKAVPEEAIPDLIKYIHCNVVGIQKLVRGFRTLWHKKMHPPQATPEVAKPEPGDAAMDMDAPKQSTETPADGTARIEAESESPASATIPESEYAMSIRQLELKITSMATYQKGAQHYRKCWYVKPETLKAYNLEELQEKVTERKVYKSIDKKDLNKSVDGPQTHCAAPEVATPKSSRATPSVTITQFTVKADPEAKWQLEKLPPKPAPAAATPKPVQATPGKVAASPAPVGSSPAVASKASAHRIQLTTLTNFMKPKPAKCTSPDTKPSSVLSAVGASQNVSSGVPATSSGSSQCQVIDLTGDLSNNAMTCSSGGSGVTLVPITSTPANHLSTDAMVLSSSDAVSVQTNGAETRIVTASSVDSVSDKKTNEVEMTDASEVIVLG